MAYQGSAPSPAYSSASRKPARPSYIPHPKEYEEADIGPFWGSLASVAGGFIISLYGAFLGLTTLPSWLVQQFLVGSSLPAVDAGWLLFLSGAVIVFVGFFSFTSVHHRGDGALIWGLVFVLGLIVTGTGFYFASLVAVTGGAHIFWWKPKALGGTDSISRAKSAGARTQ